MKIVLLSGGLEEKIWPLSSNAYSYQLLQMFSYDPACNMPKEQKCSMVQRVCAQLVTAGYKDDLVVVANESHREVIEEQLRDFQVDIIYEPYQRGSYPAVVLASAYLNDMKGLKDDEPILFCSADSYVNLDYYKSLDRVAELIQNTPSLLGVVGVTPQRASVKRMRRHYLLRQKENYDGWFITDKFKIEPRSRKTKEYIQAGALWYSGAFALRKENLKEWMKRWGIPLHYHLVRDQYTYLKGGAITQEILSHDCHKKAVVHYQGEWEDVGDWDGFTEKTTESTCGNVYTDEKTKNCKIINNYNIPMIVQGCKNLVIAATRDGIVIADRGCKGLIKFIKKTVQKRQREECRCGEKMFVEHIKGDNSKTATANMLMYEGRFTTYHCHMKHSEAIIILQGEAEVIKVGKKYRLLPGQSISFEREECHAIRAVTRLRYIRVVAGNLSEKDVDDVFYSWEDTLEGIVKCSKKRKLELGYTLIEQGRKLMRRKHKIFPGKNSNPS